MSTQDLTAEYEAFEACLDEINDFVGTLNHYLPTTVAVGLRVHLETLLRTLLECELCTHAQAREFVRVFEREVLKEEGCDE